MVNKDQFISLLSKYVSDKLSAKEHSDFFEAVASGKYDDLLLQHIENNLEINKGVNDEVGIAPYRSAEMLHKIYNAEKQNSLIIPRVNSKTKIIRWAAAVAAIAVIVFSAYLYTATINNDSLSNNVFLKDMYEKINNTSQPLKIELEEGSIVTLQPGSSIHYPAHFLKDKREVYLNGEAFFEVSKNASRPFFVYNKNIVTHVLGTSFNVKLNPKNQQVEVSVRTGKVEVYENKTSAKIGSANKSNGVILLPNQKVIYDQQSRQFVASLADVPLPIIEESPSDKTASINFVFEATPLKTVLENLEKSYGIEIITENENIYKCLFTGDISRQDLYTRLDIICQSAQANYELKGTMILIKGKGCN